MLVLGLPDYCFDIWNDCRKEACNGNERAGSKACWNVQENELRSQALELVVSKVRAALAAGSLETARNLLDPALQHFQNEAALAQLNNEINLEQSRHDKMANAREALCRRDGASNAAEETLAAISGDPPPMTPTPSPR